MHQRTMQNLTPNSIPPAETGLESFDNSPGIWTGDSYESISDYEWSSLALISNEKNWEEDDWEDDDEDWDDEDEDEEEDWTEEDWTEEDEEEDWDDEKDWL